jgi:hypothetical protein
VKSEEDPVDPLRICTAGGIQSAFANGTCPNRNIIKVANVSKKSLMKEDFKVIAIAPSYYMTYGNKIVKDSLLFTIMKWEEDIISDFHLSATPINNN